MFFDHPDFDDHHAVLFVSDPDSGLRGIIALHRLRGDASAVGGIRFRPYPDDHAALTDALRLSRAMTAKAVLARLPVGGGKTVVLGDPSSDKTRPVLHALAREIEALGGRYMGGPDVGTSPADMDVMSEVTPRVGGTTARMGVGGSAPPTAEGTFNAVRALAAHLNGTEDFEGVHVAIQGVGAVGEDLAGRLAGVGATLTITDVDHDRLKRVADETGATPAAADDILTVEADILSPCALGGVLAASTIPALNVRGVCGAANNQLCTPQDATRLRERGIVFVPDPIASAGGVIAGIAAEGVISSEYARTQLEAIYDRTRDVLAQAQAEGRSEVEVAADLVQRVLDEERE